MEGWTLIEHNKYINTDPIQRYFVEGEKFADTVKIVVARYHNNIDLSECAFSVVAKNVQKDVVQQDCRFEVADDTISLFWQVDSAFTAVAGTLELEIRATKNAEMILKYTVEPVFVKPSYYGTGGTIYKEIEKKVEELDSKIDEVSTSAENWGDYDGTTINTVYVPDYQGHKAINASIKLSSNDDNAITVVPSGLYAKDYGEKISGIGFSLSSVIGRVEELEAVKWGDWVAESQAEAKYSEATLVKVHGKNTFRILPKISSTSDNALVMATDGLYVKTTESIAFKDYDGTLCDTYVRKDSDGAYYVQAVPQISASAENALKSTQAGLFVEDLSGTVSSMGNSLSSVQNRVTELEQKTAAEWENGESTTAKATHNVQSGKQSLTVDVKISATGNNAVSVDESGIFVDDKTDIISSMGRSVDVAHQRITALESVEWGDWAAETQAEAKYSEVVLVKVQGKNTFRVLPKVSSSSGNALTMATDGLYVSPSGGVDLEAISTDYGTILIDKAQEVPTIEISQAVGKSTNAGGGEIFNNYSTNVADAQGTHAEGESTKALGRYSHSENFQTKAQGNYSHAQGYGTEAQGECSHSEGNNTKAINAASHAEGSLSEAGGIASHAQNMHCHATGNYSHAGGQNTVAKGEAQTAIGRYNKPDDENMGNNYAFIVGNGNEADRKNAYTLTWNGYGWYENGAGTDSEWIPEQDGDFATKKYVDSRAYPGVSSSDGNALEETESGLFVKKAMEQYKIEYSNGSLYHDGVQLTYNDIKESIQDVGKFVFVYYSTLYLIPAFVNDSTSQFGAEAICFSTSYMVQDTAVMYRIIINESDIVRIENKRLVDENHVYTESIEEWEEIPGMLEVPSVSAVKNYVSDTLGNIETALASITGEIVASGNGVK